MFMNASSHVIAQDIQFSACQIFKEEHLRSLHTKDCRFAVVSLVGTEHANNY